MKSPLQPQLPKTSAQADGRFQMRRVGIRRSLSQDLYHFLRTARWPTLLAAISAVYLLANAIFAAGFAAGGGVEGARAGSFWDAFHFSVQTMATIGYGAMHPVSGLAHFLVMLESLFGLLFTAMATGIIFAKFATPVPRVLFSEVAVVGLADGKPALMFRMANEREKHMIVEAQVNVTFSFDDVDPDGSHRRRLIDLPLARTRSPLFALSWTAYHFIDEKSPLFGLTSEELHRRSANLLITFTGIDDTLSQTVHARKAYSAATILFGVKFVDILLSDERGQRYMDYRRFHDVVPLGEQTIIGA